MSAGQALRELVAFEGSVECRLEQGAINLALRGRERTGAVVEALFAGASASGGLAVLPRELHEVRLFERPLQLKSRELQLDLTCRSLQLHRDVGRPFFKAVPPLSVPFARRAGWTVLLSVLRIPGAARLLMALRGKR
jgi:hypothetical protein